MLPVANRLLRWGYGILSALLLLPLTAQAQSGVFTVATPATSPVVIPTAGGAFNYSIETTNLTGAALTMDIWVVIEGNDMVLTRRPVQVHLDVNEVWTYASLQRVPEMAPAGEYAYTVYTGTYPDVVLSSASFPFVKEGVMPNRRRIRRDPALWEWSVVPMGRRRIRRGPAKGETQQQPATYHLDAAYPNPFNPSTQIGFALPEEGEVRLAVYDMLGREVAVLVDGLRAAGQHQVTWEAASDLPSGLYLYRLDAPGFTASRVLTLLK